MTTPAAAHQPVDIAWTTAALCLAADPHLFYPDAGQPTTPAQQICHACPVINECLAYALATNQRHGVWGATSPTQRRQLQQATS